MQNVWSNSQCFKQNENPNRASHSLQSESNNGFYYSGPTSLPGFQNPKEVDNTRRSSWFEMTNQKCFPEGDSGSSSLTMFGQAWSSRRDSTASNASSKQGSLGSQEWGKMVDEVILEEVNAVKENIGNPSNKFTVF